VVVDQSTSVEGSTAPGNNIEHTEVFQVFFPDGTMSSTTGGQQNIEELRDLVLAATSEGFTLEVNSDLMRSSVKEYEKNNLVNACLLQYPFGRGGIDEERIKHNTGFLANSMDIQDYVEHLSRLSQPQFHHALFVLILYNISFKQNMVRTAGLKSRNKLHATHIATEITPENVFDAIDSKRRKTLQANTPGATYLTAIDAVTGAIPHTNEATKKARGLGEAHQHHFGNSAWFLTVTPDDDNSFLIQAYSGVQIDDDTPIESLSDEELYARSKERTKL